ncbi:gliding motility-associated C-terminal domain-containing protein [Spirochaeta isovalerica]|uniref:Flagellar hook assembly protein FlgD n=1 Tax=Spirochaeta isovalerica TaxID=150 RepID=A0A841RDM8_9SPIO|nr:gliding motility-associated C-terminal domain-containing protein [Spirochaeta isovalerica]MBB6481337.1 flagellar hook assembly protein FlgD [Spirochaeta isovalerica]
MKGIRFLFLFSVVSWFVVSCATYKGDIPLEGPWWEVRYISPANGDGIQVVAEFPLSMEYREGLALAGYRLSILDESDRTIWSETYGKSIPEGKKRITGRKTPLDLPETVRWNGTEDSGSFASDGSYVLKVDGWDYSGNTGSVIGFRIIVDNTPPSAEISIPYRKFSPNGDGNRDFLDIYQSGSGEDLWTGTLFNSQGEEIRIYNWTGLPYAFQWDGSDSQGNLIETGEYSYKLTSTDKAGNSSLFEETGLYMENRFFVISCDSNLSHFSPNGDGIKDTVSIKLGADNATDIASAQMNIINERGVVVRHFNLDSGSYEGLIIFDGKNDTGRLLPEGYYYAVYSVEYNNGNTPSVTSGALELDITPPRAVLSNSVRIFSPDGDGKSDSISINQTTSTEPVWKGAIVNQSGNSVKTHQWNDKAFSFSWDGLDDSGNPAPDGLYNYVLESTDPAGTSARFQSNPFTIDRRPTPIQLSNVTRVFSPNGDGFYDFAQWDMSQEIREGVISWSSSIQDESRETVFDYGVHQSGNIPESLTWNGMNKEGEIQEGKFFVVYSVEYEKGNLSRILSESPVILDLTPPSIQCRLTGLPFSPDGDGTNDSLVIEVDVTDNYAVDYWTAYILDPNDQVFMVLPSTLFTSGKYIWDGYSANGELIQSASDYTVKIVAEDSVGNEVAHTESLPTDILVLKEGNRLKISISSIYFKPFTAEYLDVEPQLADNNIRTLDRLAQVLQKYSSYKIRIEGHAVRVYWDKLDRWLKEENDVLLPLSANRAESIRDALIMRGIDGNRISTGGQGGYMPVVPHSDPINRWKNRRVEFILIK